MPPRTIFWANSHGVTSNGMRQYPASPVRLSFDPNFAEAYLGWGDCLVTVKRYEEAVSPLRNAERLMPGNPAVHHSLATALERSGHKEEAAKEFAIHRSLIFSRSRSGQLAIMRRSISFFYLRPLVVQSRRTRRCSRGRLLHEETSEIPLSRLTRRHFMSGMMAGALLIPRSPGLLLPEAPLIPSKKFLRRRVGFVGSIPADTRRKSTFLSRRVQAAPFSTMTTMDGWTFTW